MEALVFPNPTTHELFVTLKAPSDTNYSVTVFNNIGQLVIQNEYDNDGIKRMDVSAWETGSYVLRIVSGPKTITKNIMIVD